MTNDELRKQNNKKKLKDLQKWRSKRDLQYEWQQSKKEKWCTFVALSNPDVSFFDNVGIWRDFTLLGLSPPFWFWFLTKMGNSDDFLFKRLLRNRGRQKTDEIKYYPPKRCQIFSVNAYLLPPIFELDLFLKSK